MRSLVASGLLLMIAAPISATAQQYADIQIYYGGTEGNIYYFFTQEVLRSVTKVTGRIDYRPKPGYSNNIGFEFYDVSCRTSSISKRTSYSWGNDKVYEHTVKWFKPTLARHLRLLRLVCGRERLSGVHYSPSDMLRGDFLSRVTQQLNVPQSVASQRPRIVSQPSVSGSAMSTAANRCISLSPKNITYTMYNPYMPSGSRNSSSNDSETDVEFVCGAVSGYTHLRARLTLGRNKNGICQKSGDGLVSANFVLVVKEYDNLRSTRLNGYFDCIYSVEKWKLNNNWSID